jgi:predicted enzyme related to lactoylglutathione lyase
MKNYLGRIVLLVNDYEKSAQFYETHFGFKRMFDVTTDVGQRFLHIGAEPLDTLGIWFLKADSKKQKERVGNQTGEQPTLVIYTTEIEELHERLSKHKVKLKGGLVKTPDYSFFHCYDIDGNELVVTELVS